MALGLNHALLIGTLVRDPDLRYTPAGLAVLRLDLGGDDHLHDEEGALRARPWYQRVTVFGAQAERVVDHLRTGTPLWVEGRLERRTYEADDGSTRATLDLIGRRVELLGLGARDEDDAFAIDARDQPRLRDAANRVRLIGNLTRDAEVDRTEQGHARARFSVAVQERPASERGPDFVDVQAWRDRAQACEGLAKGDPVYLEGRLITDAWTDGDGRRRYANRIEAQRVERIERLPRVGDRPPEGAAADPAAAPATDGSATEATPF